MRAAWLAIVAFVLAAGILWLPFDSYTPLYETRSINSVPAGEIVPGFRLAQQVRPPSAGADPGSLSSCFAIRFATYARHNKGLFGVRWRQGRHEQSWTIAFRDLVDNGYRHFCPMAFSAHRPFQLEVSGVNGKPGRSATLWLVEDTRFGNAELFPEQGAQGKAISLQGSIRHRASAAGIARIDHGAWLIGWLCTLAIGITTLLTGLGCSHKAGNRLP